MKRRILTSESRGDILTLILTINVVGRDLSFKVGKTSANARWEKPLNIFSEAE